MWREYTREVPARPGWALLSTALALCGSLGLAYSLTGKHQVPAGLNERRHLPHWPISFVLRSSFVEVTDQYAIDSLDGERQRAVFASPSGAGETVVLSYELSAEDQSGDQFNAVARDERGEIHLIDMGICQGSCMIVRTPHGTGFLAEGMTDSGLQIRVQYTSGEPEFRALRNMREICKSIEWQPWSVTP